MATESSVRRIGTLTASADLSSSQYKYAKISGARTATVAAASTDRPIGVVLNKPTSGQPIDLAIEGEVMILCGATVVAGDDLMSDAQGRAITAVANAGANWAYGIALEPGVVGQVISALIPGFTRKL